MDEYIEREVATNVVCNILWKMNDLSTSVMAKALNSIPAADVAPVRHGRWVQVIVHIEFEDGFVDRVEEYCSVCHEQNEKLCTYFCPNCGAKMDLEDNDG